MIALRRRAARPLLAAVIVVAVALVAGCGAAATPRPSGTPSRAPGTPALTPVPGGTAPAPSLPSTTDTSFGRIWDALPSWFPKLPGQKPADTGGGPTSGSFAANMDVDAAVRLVESGLLANGFTVDAGSPLEDGTVVLNASGAREGCAAEVRFTPMSGTVVMSVLYGADCPFS